MTDPYDEMPSWLEVEAPEPDPESEFEPGAAVPTTALVKGTRGAQLFIPEMDLPVSLRRRFGSGADGVARGVTFFPDRTEGLQPGNALLNLSMASMLGLIAWGGAMATSNALSVGIVGMSAWAMWALVGSWSLLMGAGSVLVLVLTFLKLAHEIHVERQVRQGQWPYGIFLMPGALVFRSQESCHVVPKRLIEGTTILRGGDDYHRCPAVSLDPQDEDARQSVCLEGRFLMSPLEINRQIEGWLNQGGGEDMAPIVDERPGSFVRALPKEVQAPSAQSSLYATPLVVLDSPLERLWKHITGGRRAVSVEGALEVSGWGLRAMIGDDEPVEVPWESPFVVSLSVWLISEQTAELNVGVRSRGAAPTSSTLGWRVRLPQSSVSSSLPLKESGHPYLTLEDFAQLWPALVFYAAVHGDDVPATAVKLPELQASAKERELLTG